MAYDEILRELDGRPAAGEENPCTPSEAGRSTNPSTPDAARCRSEGRSTGGTMLVMSWAGAGLCVRAGGAYQNDRPPANKSEAKVWQSVCRQTRLSLDEPRGLILGTHRI